MWSLCPRKTTSYRSKWRICVFLTCSKKLTSENIIFHYEDDLFWGTSNPKKLLAMQKWISVPNLKSLAQSFSKKLSFKHWRQVWFLDSTSGFDYYKLTGLFWVKMALGKSIFQIFFLFSHQVCIYMGKSLRQSGGPKNSEKVATYLGLMRIFSVFTVILAYLRLF